MNAELKARVFAAIAAEPSPTRAAVNRRNILISILALTSGVGAFVIFALLTSEGQLVRLGGEVASHRHLQRPIWLVATTAGGALGVAATALWFALCRGRRCWLGHHSVVVGGSVHEQTQLDALPSSAVDHQPLRDCKRPRHHRGTRNE